MLTIKLKKKPNFGPTYESFEISNSTGLVIVSGFRNEGWITVTGGASEAEFRSNTQFVKDLLEDHDEKQRLPARIQSALSKQKFADWYTTGDFDKWISGDVPTITDQKILDDIRTLFKL